MLAHQNSAEPITFATMSLSDMMQVTEQLNQVLAAESALLKAMKVRELPPLQEQKAALSDQLEHFRLALAVDRSPIEHATDRERERMMMLADELALQIEENMRHTELARGVNARVMGMLSEAVSGSQRATTYGAHGRADTKSGALSVPLNINAQA